MPLAAPTGVSIAYAAHGGMPRTEATLHIDAAGNGRMFLGSAMSLPPAGDLDRVGSFEGTVDARALQRLVRLVTTLPDDLPEGGPPSPGSVIRSLAVTVDGRPREVTIPGYAPPPLDEVERRLQEAMVALIASPVQAVSAKLEVEADGGLTLVLSSVGSGAATLRFAADDGRVTAGGTLVVLSATGEMHGTTSLDPAIVSRVVPTGTTRLAPGAVLRFLFTKPADVPKGRATVSGGIEVDLESGGQFRRVTVQAAPVSYRG